MSRRERRTVETRTAILAAARALFDERGYHETTVDDIAARADVAQRTFFRYFPTKEAVLFGPAEDIRALMLAELAARPLDEAPLRSLLAAICRTMPLVEERRADLDWAFSVMREQLDAIREPATIKAQFAAELAEAVAVRMGVSLDDDPRPLAWSGLAMSCFGATMRACSGTDRPVREAFDELLAVTSVALGSALDAGHEPRAAAGDAGTEAARDVATVGAS